jgi:hypothetical protein
MLCCTGFTLIRNGINYLADPYFCDFVEVLIYSEALYRVVLKVDTNISEVPSTSSLAVTSFNN